MAKSFCAIAAACGADNAGTDGAVGALEVLKEIAIKYNVGAVLSDEDSTLVSESLPKIGCKNTSTAAGGAFQGNDSFTFDAEGAGVTLRVASKLSCDCAADADRNPMVWTVDTTLEKIGGNAYIGKLIFNYTFIGFGNDSKTGKPKVMFNYSHKRIFTGESLEVNLLGEGKPASTSHMNFSNVLQWGFCMIATCTVKTSQGSFEI